MFTIGDAIHQIRKEKRLTFKQLHDLTGVSTSTLLNIENGGNFERATLEKIAIGLKLNVDEIYSRLRIQQSDVKKDSEASRYICQNPSHADLHAVLDGILNSGKEDLITTIEVSLEALSASASGEGRTSAVRCPATMKELQESASLPNSREFIIDRATKGKGKGRR